MPWHDDPDAVASELNALVPGEQPDADSQRLEDWLQALVGRKGADLLLVAGSPPCVRVDGHVIRLDEPTLDGDEIERAVRPALPAYAQQRYDDTGIADASLEGARPRPVPHQHPSRTRPPGGDHPRAARPGRQGWPA